MSTLSPTRRLLKRPSLRVDHSCPRVTALALTSEISCISKPAFSKAITISPRIFPVSVVCRPTHVTLSQYGSSKGPSTSGRGGHAPRTIDLLGMPATLGTWKRARETSQNAHEKPAGNTERAGHNFAEAPSPTSLPDAFFSPSLMASSSEIGGNQNHLDSSGRLPH